MAQQYFKNFPTIDWNGMVMVDLSRRAAVLQKLSGNPYLFLPYDIQEKDTIESIAYHYYGDPKLSWMIILANNIIDPYTDFFKSEEKLKNFIIDKYKAQAEASESRTLKRYEVLEWTKNTTITDNIIYYYNRYNKDIQLNPASFERFGDGDFLPLRYFEYEERENENKRTIKLISDTYVTQVQREMKALLNG